jgi:hypothetical protein
MTQTTQPRSWALIENTDRDLTKNNEKSTDFQSTDLQSEDLLHEDTQGENLQSMDLQSDNLQGEDNLSLFLSVYDNLNKLSDMLNRLDNAISRRLIKQNYIE